MRSNRIRRWDNVLAFLNGDTTVTWKEDRLRVLLNSCVDLFLDRKSKLVDGHPLAEESYPGSESEVLYESMSAARNYAFLAIGDTSRCDPFFAMLLDVYVGERLFRCHHCGRIQIGRTDQKFCRRKAGGSSCRVKWHYKQNPEKKKEQVRRWRKKNPGMG